MYPMFSHHWVHSAICPYHSVTYAIFSNHSVNFKVKILTDSELGLLFYSRKQIFWTIAKVKNGRYFIIHIILHLPLRGIEEIENKFLLIYNEP